MSGRTKKEPLVRMVKRDDISAKRAWAYRGIAFVAALATGGLLILVLGHNPVAVYGDMVVGSWGSPTVIKETIKLAIPLLICAIGLALAFKMKFWNIGGEGQIIVGAIAAGYFGFFMSDLLPQPLLTIVMFVAGALVGGIYGLIPAFFKAKWNTNETLFTLMLNYVALAVIKFLMNGPWKAPGSSFPKMPMIPSDVRLAQVFGVHWGWILALILVVIAWFYFKRTKQGYELSVVGESENTARYAGINVKWVIMRTMFISGALCGLVGFLQFAGSDYTITEGIAGGVGFTAITVAWLGKMNPFAMLVVSVFIAMLERGSNTIQTIYKIPASASDLLIGIILFFMIGCEFFITYRLVFRGRGVPDTPEVDPTAAPTEATASEPAPKPGSEEVA
jgi:simple sugar transport system permease protein